MFTAANLLLGVLAAFVIGLSKTAIPGGGLLATPLIAMVVSGRLIAGTTLPLLLVADVFAVCWFGRHARWDVLTPLVRSVAVGFAFGTAFYVAVGAGGRALDLVLGGSIGVLVVLQIVRIVRRSPAVRSTPALAAGVGITGGFTTFVANAAGPVMNTYLVGIGLPKEQLIGTTSWFYFGVNAAKIPVYLAIGAWAGGGPFFTATTLWYDLVLAPVVVVTLFAGRALLARIPQQTFTIAVLALAGLAAVKLLVGL